MKLTIPLTSGLSHSLNGFHCVSDLGIEDQVLRILFTARVMDVMEYLSYVRLEVWW